MEIEKADLRTFYTETLKLIGQRESLITHEQT